MALVFVQNALQRTLNWFSTFPNGNVEVERDSVVSTGGLPERMVAQMKIEFSDSAVSFKSSCKKKAVKIEYHLLNDIITKALTAKAGSFDVVTQEPFDMIVAIMGGIKLNWSEIIFGMLKTKAHPLTNQASAQFLEAKKETGDEDKADVEAKRAAVMESTVAATQAKRLEATSFKGEAVVLPATKRKRTTVGRAAPAVKAFSIVPTVVEAFPIHKVKPSRSSERQPTAAKRKLIVEEDIDSEDAVSGLVLLIRD
ncbi:hypothetical protein F511_15127 [Dorcoceras hygrometricum]|uniref:Uncharacterized protein n=1 Tax=Dorcoceras hygrometricum TaxID=472368 RepID=A0A2Z7C4P9_9LAMI|nr:hypothetical protein F511_15127 [Dorcoceras hygrometricum]